jgi:hypothetical protein
MLLESVYSVFDKIARKRGVFKVRMHCVHAVYRIKFVPLRFVVLRLRWKPSETPMLPLQGCPSHSPNTPS